MTVEKILSAKITRPGISGVVQRERLFGLLDNKMEKPVVWVSSPAGSGKTTLVSSYLDSRKFPCIWYHCDEGDADLATFFYYMGLAAKKAAPGQKKPFPLLTPEYLAGTPTFTRRYFEQLYNRLVARSNSPVTGHVFYIVFDNYQDVPADSLFHNVMADGFDMVPEGLRIIVISRSDPHSALARLQANSKINLLAYSDIRFTLKESKELIHRRLPKLDTESAKAMHGNTQGWAAGIILMLERTKLSGKMIAPAAKLAYDRLFDYFAGEIFNKTEKGVQDFLLKTALFPTLSVSLAGKLTGSDNAERILSALNRHNYFTERLFGSGNDYQYHPLFRDFLLNRLKTRYRPHELTLIRAQAALFLEQSGQIEDAARLYRDAGDWRNLARMVTDHAHALFLQGRNVTVEEWIAGIPGIFADGNPWLLYWAGMCSFPLDMPRTRKYLEKAFALFRTVDDTSGIYLSWAGIVDTYAFEFDEWKRLDKYIAVFEDLRKTYPSFPSKNIDLIASSRMLIALTLRKTDQPQWVQGWFKRVSTLLQENPSVDIQMDTIFFMSVYYLWKGEYHRNAILLEMAETELLYRKPPPFVAIRIKLMKGIHYWITAQYHSALHVLSEGLDISGKSGVHVFDSLLWGFKAAAEMAPGNMESAGKSLHNQVAASLVTAKTLDIFFCHMNSAWYAILTGKASLAAENLEIIAAKVKKMGNPYYSALWHIGMALVAFLQDRRREAKTHIRSAHRISLDMKSQVVEWYSLLIGAYILLQKGREKEGLLSLHNALVLGKSHGYIHLEFYQPQVMQFLYAKALEKGIEREYVKGLIKKLGLTPPVSPDSTTSAINLEKLALSDKNPHPRQV